MRPILSILLALVAIVNLHIAHAQNQPSPLPVQQLRVGELFSLIIKADGDNNPPAVIKSRELPEDAVMLRNLDGSRTFMWIPESTHIGETSFSVTVIDANDPTISATYPILLNVAEEVDGNESTEAVAQSAPEPQVRLQLGFALPLQCRIAFGRSSAALLGGLLGCSQGTEGIVSSQNRSRRPRRPARDGAIIR